MKIAWKQVIVAFLLGAVIEAVAMAGPWCGPRSHRQWGKSEDIQKKMLERFDSKLSLTADQRQQVATILEGKRTKIDALRAEMRPKFEEIRNATRAEIRQLLTPEQQTKFDKMTAEFDAKAKKFHGRWGGGGMEGGAKCAR